MSLDRISTNSSIPQAPDLTREKQYEAIGQCMCQDCQMPVKVLFDIDTKKTFIEGHTREEEETYVQEQRTKFFNGPDRVERVKRHRTVRKECPGSRKEHQLEQSGSTTSSEDSAN